MPLESIDLLSIPSEYHDLATIFLLKIMHFHFHLIAPGDCAIDLLPGAVLV